MLDTLIFYVIVTGILVLSYVVPLCIVNNLLGRHTRTRKLFSRELNNPYCN